MPVATDLLPTPVATPPPQESTRPSISVEINTATRKQHTELNRLIIDRLPLALPPHARSPERYITGVSAFATLYVAFEASFPDVDAQRGEFSSHELEMASWLQHLRPPGLARAQHLLRDVGCTRPLAANSERHQDQKLYSRVREICTQQPHALIAYTWVMYMAIFSGGRWIRQQLASAGPEFWQNNSAAEKSSGFDFLSFPDSNEDGEDLKREYKARLAEGEHLLTVKERQDVLDAAVDLFEMCIDIVGKLDVEVARQQEKRRSIVSRDRVIVRLVSLAVVAVVFVCLWNVALPKFQITNG